MPTATKYFGNYTVSEYALVKGELIKKYRGTYNSSAIDAVCRYLAKNDWPKERKDSYTAALSYVGSSREESLRLLKACDTGQALFDMARYGEGFKRVYEHVPGLDDEPK